MKDRFKFRARRPCGDWVVGGLHRNGLDEWCITTADGQMCYLIEIDTAGQCTGLKDRNGVLIYEGDIISYGGRKAWVTQVKRMDDGAFCTMPRIVSTKRTVKELLDFSIQAYHEQTIEVIGNIHESPELLA